MILIILFLGTMLRNGFNSQRTRWHYNVIFLCYYILNLNEINILTLMALHYYIIMSIYTECMAWPSYYNECTCSTWIPVSLCMKSSSTTTMLKVEISTIRLYLIHLSSHQIALVLKRRHILLTNVYLVY